MDEVPTPKLFVNEDLSKPENRLNSFRRGHLRRSNERLSMLETQYEALRRRRRDAQ